MSVIVVVEPNAEREVAVKQNIENSLVATAPNPKTESPFEEYEARRPTPASRTIHPSELVSVAPMKKIELRCVRCDSGMPIDGMVNVER